jgi:cell division protein FtsI (penicillin-binding protein 3)
MSIKHTIGIASPSSPVPDGLTNQSIAYFENLGFKVKFIGVGKVIKQSINPGETFKKNQIITIELS